MDKNYKSVRDEKPKRIDMHVMERLIVCVYESGREKRTNIARNCNLSYNKCVKYLWFLKMIGFIKEYNENGYAMFGLTSNGISFYKRLFSSVL